MCIFPEKGCNSRKWDVKNSHIRDIVLGNILQKEMFKIGNDKHYRMTEESLKFIEMRDKQKYPKESLFVNAAIQYFGRGIEQENLMDELEDIQDKLDRIEKKIEENTGKKNSSFSSDAEKKELYGKPDFLK